MSTVLTKAVVTTTSAPSGASVLPRYPNGISGLQKGTVATNGAAPANGAASGVTPLVKVLNTTFTQVDTTQAAATILVCDGTAMTSDEANQVKDAQNYGVGSLAGTVQGAGVGTAGSTTGQVAGYSLNGD